MLLKADCSGYLCTFCLIPEVFIDKVVMIDSITEKMNWPRLKINANLKDNSGSLKINILSSCFFKPFAKDYI